ncbi:MAG: asparaginase [Candidatus Rokubacteria bacterium]|nr:asparaginase [Candidatus Rokubacteria bacterium]
MTLPRVAIIGTGGTISSVGKDSLDVWQYMDHGTKLEADELVADIPELASVADVVPVRHRAMSSPAIGPKDWLELGTLVEDVAARSPRVDGIVITHGTATLEETAYFLTLTSKVSVPIVVVGAQRPFSGLSSDARMNLVSATRVAGSAEARGLGVLVLLNDEIQAAREVTKSSTLRLETFRSHDLGMLGYADPDGRVAIYRRPTRRHAPDTEFDVRGASDLPRVDIAYSYAGADATAIAAFVQAGARAIVSASMAPGMTTLAEMTALLEARRRGALVAISSRAGSGRVLLRTRFREQGLLVADNLSPQKARILLMLALTVTDDVTRVQRMFDQY